MFLTDISFGSTLVGSGLRFGPAADEYWFEILRSLQGKVSTYPRFLLLLENAKLPGRRVVRRARAHQSRRGNDSGIQADPFS
jgi:hypothetical protein